MPAKHPAAHIPGSSEATRVLFIGDIVGKPGRRAVTRLLPDLRRELNLDVVIANTENLAHGKGITPSTWEEMRAAGVDIGTGGNHTYDKPQAEEMLNDPDARLVRPFNIAPDSAGQGIKTFTVSQKKVTVINLLGEFAMSPAPVENAFTAMRTLLERGLPDSDITLVDVHAIATSEKIVMGWYLDGQVSAIVGTDTHVPTADTRILPNGTAYVTDVGMVGIKDSSLGVDWHGPLDKFLNQSTGPWEIPERGLVEFQAVLIEIKQGRAVSIERITREIEV